MDDILKSILESGENLPRSGLTREDVQTFTDEFALRIDVVKKGIEFGKLVPGVGIDIDIYYRLITSRPVISYLPPVM